MIFCCCIRGDTLSVVIGITNNKGGCGKTSLMTNLIGVITSAESAKVLQIDLDGQGNAADACGLPEARMTTADVLNGKISLSGAKKEVNPFLDVLQAGDSMSTFEFDILPMLKRYDNPFGILKPHIDQVRTKYDYIFIDTPPSLSLLVGNTFLASDHILIPFVPEPDSVKGFKRVVETIGDFNQAGNKINILSVVPMMVESRTTVHSDILQQARRYCDENNITIWDGVIPRSVYVPKARAYERKPATLGKMRNTEAIKAYYDLWDFLSDKIKEGQKP